MRISDEYFSVELLSGVAGSTTTSLKCPLFNPQVERFKNRLCYVAVESIVIHYHSASDKVNSFTLNSGQPFSQRGSTALSQNIFAVATSDKVYDYHNGNCKANGILAYMPPTQVEVNILDDDDTQLAAADIDSSRIKLRFYLCDE